MLRRIFSVAVAAATAACSVVGVRSGTEEPKFQIVERIGDLEIRRYDERIAAETVVTGTDEQARNDGFRRLAGYIFGANVKGASVAMTAPVEQSSETIAMTAPVGQAADGAGSWRIQFFMPSQFKRIEDLPTPKDKSVKLAVVPARTYAVLTFSGARDAEAMKAKQAELLQKLAATAWRADGEPLNWFYDPPWTIPALRRNEVAVPVVRAM